MQCARLFVVLLWPLGAFADTSVPQISVTGTGTVTAEPDMATVFLSVSREALTASAALAETNEAASRVLQTVAQAGISSSDVQTSSISLSPVWEQANARPRQIRGYVASNDLAVRLREIENVGVFLDAVVRDGANRLNGLSFDLEDTTGLEQQARAIAVADARSKAATLAAAAEVALGDVLSITEGGHGGVPGTVMRGAALESAAIATGETHIQVSVTVVYAIVQ